MKNVVISVAVSLLSVVSIKWCLFFLSLSSQRTLGIRKPYTEKSEFLSRFLYQYHVLPEVA